MCLIDLVFLRFRPCEEQLPGHGISCANQNIFFEKLPTKVKVNCSFENEVLSIEIEKGKDPIDCEGTAHLRVVTNDQTTLKYCPIQLQLELCCFQICTQVFDF
jgi:hypothetical protein